jgi:hypothetical protein
MKVEDRILLPKSPLYDNVNLSSKNIMLEFYSIGYGDVIDMVPLIYSILNKYNSNICIKTNKNDLPFGLIDKNRIIVAAYDEQINTSSYELIKLNDILKYNINCPMWLRHLIYAGIDELYMFDDPFPLIDNDKALKLKKELGQNYIIFHSYNSRIEFSGRNTEKKNLLRVKDFFSSKGYKIYDIGNDNAEPVCTHLRGLSHEELFIIIKNCRGFVGIDSYPMHVASLYKKPILGFFGSTHPFSVLPLFRPIVLVRNEKLRCLGCLAKNKMKNSGAKCIRIKEFCRYINPELIDNKILEFSKLINKQATSDTYNDFLRYLISIGKSEFELQNTLDHILTDKIEDDGIFSKVLSPGQFPNESIDNIKVNPKY